MTCTERALLYGDATPLVGVLTEPMPARGRAAEAPLVVLGNAGIVHHVGPNRMNVLLARSLAAAGFAAFRFDLAGIGDSPPRCDGRELADGISSDIGETLDLLERTVGARRFVVAGLCSGADNAVRAARRDARVVGAIALDGTVYRTRGFYLRHYGRRLLRADIWGRVLSGRHPAWRAIRGALAWRPQGDREAACDVRPDFFRTGFASREEVIAHLRPALGRGVQLLYVFTGGWETLYNYRTQLLDAFPEVDFSGRLRLEHHAAADHTFSALADRRRLCATVVDWMETAPFTPAPPPPRTS